MNHEQLMETEEWQRLRAYVYWRDRGRCVICGGAGCDTHHFSYLWGFFNPLTVSLLCRPCHLVWQGCDPHHLADDHPLKPTLTEIARLSRNLGKGRLFPSPVVVDFLGD
jgi:hypothetical protein